MPSVLHDLTTEHVGPRCVPLTCLAVLTQAIADAGGATKVAAANNWVMALTATGRVFLWGEPPVPESRGQNLIQDLGPAGVLLWWGGGLGVLRV
jgi:hypothetical protein